MQYYTVNDNTAYDRFYALFDAIYDADYTNLKEDSYLCPECEKILIWKKWVEPRIVRLSKPLFGDMVFSTASADGVLVSQRFKDLYEKSGLKGITAFYKLDNVLVSRNAKKQLIPPPYYYIEIAMANAIYDPERTISFPDTGCIYKKNVEITKDGVKRCRLCRPYNFGGYPAFKGFGIKYLDDNLLDIFTFYPRSKDEHFSQNFVDWALENNITNFKGKIIKTEDYVSEFTPIDELVNKIEQEHIERLKRGEEY